MTLKIVYDTNVVVSAALKSGSIPASLIALAMAKQVRLFLSPLILDEYTEVLKRPKFRLNPAATDRFLRDLRRAAQTTSEHYLPLWGMKPTVLNQRNLLDLHTLTRTH